MSRGPIYRDDPPDSETVFRTLDDGACRSIVEAIDGPMTAKEISEAADVPLSTTYKKLDRLTDATLVVERTELDPRGHHRSRYALNFDRVIVRLDEEKKLGVVIEEPLDTPEKQLLDIWSTVRKEV